VTEPRYHINVFWSDEDGCWIADVPDLRSCSAHGETSREAVDEIMVAIRGWLETARDAGMDIPEPRYRPVIYRSRDSASA
jgi:predicted RNase H-like HicB family nuclease